MDTLTQHRPLLDAIATALLERETLSREDIAVLEKGGELPPRQEPPTAAPVAAVVREPEARRVPPAIGGPEPSPA